MFNFLYNGSVGQLIAPIHSQEQQLLLAIQHRQQDKIEELLMTGKVSATCSNDKGVQPFHIACQIGDRALAEKLLEMGASMTVTDRAGNTPLHYASKGASIEIVTWLVSCGVSVTARNSVGHTPYDVGGGHVVRQYLLPLQLKAEAESEPAQSVPPGQMMGVTYQYDAPPYYGHAAASPVTQPQPHLGPPPVFMPAAAAAAASSSSGPASTPPPQLSRPGVAARSGSPRRLHAPAGAVPAGDFPAASAAADLFPVDLASEDAGNAASHDVGAVSVLHAAAPAVNSSPLPQEALAAPPSALEVAPSGPATAPAAMVTEAFPVAEGGAVGGVHSGALGFKQQPAAGAGAAAAADSAASSPLHPAFGRAGALPAAAALVPPGGGVPVPGRASEAAAAFPAAAASAPVAAAPPTSPVLPPSARQQQQLQQQQPPANAQAFGWAPHRLNGSATSPPHPASAPSSMRQAGGYGGGVSSIGGPSGAAGEAGSDAAPGASGPAAAQQQSLTPGRVPHKSAADFRPIKPDGFHTSASDKKLQALYGHGQNTKIRADLAPPPTFGGPPPPGPPPPQQPLPPGAGLGAPPPPLPFPAAGAAAAAGVGSGPPPPQAPAAFSYSAYQGSGGGGGGGAPSGTMPRYVSYNAITNTASVVAAPLPRAPGAHHAASWGGPAGAYAAAPPQMPPPPAALPSLASPAEQQQKQQQPPPPLPPGVAGTSAAAAAVQTFGFPSSPSRSRGVVGGAPPIAVFNPTTDRVVSADSASSSVL